MQGDIGIHSLPEKGAKFWFTATIKIIEEERNNQFFSDKSVCVLLTRKYQETLIQEQLQDWKVNIIGRDMLKYNHAINVISDNTNLPELLNLGIPAKNIIIISDSQHTINEDINTITSPFTPKKLRHALQSCDSLLSKNSLADNQKKTEKIHPHFQSFVY